MTFYRAFSAILLVLGVCAAFPAVAQTACFPSCRDGFTCVNGACVSACNPPCPAGQRCTGAGECGAGSTPPPAVAPAPAPAPTAPQPPPVVAPPPPVATEPPPPEPPPEPAEPAGPPPPWDLTMHLLIAPGLGVDFAMGDVSRDFSQSLLMSAVGPAATLQVGIGVAPTLVLGLWGEAAIHAGGDQCVAPAAYIKECSNAAFGIGPEIAWYSPTDGSVRPWLAGGFGYRILRIAEADTSGDTTAAQVTTFRGFELIHVQAGVDFDLEASSHRPAAGVWCGDLYDLLGVRGCTRPGPQPRSLWRHQ